MKIFELTNYLDERFPLSLASDFDNNKIGLTIGSKNIELSNIMLSLDVNLKVVEEAIKKECNLIISHHPFLFTPITSISYDDEKGKILKLLFAHNISIYSMHTNLDVASGGVNDTLANILGLADITGIVAKDEFIRYGYTNTTLKDLIDLVKLKFNLEGVKYVGSLYSRITKVGIIGGSGASIEEINKAISLGINCFITGEVKLHIAQYAYSLGLNIIEINHGVEKLVFDNIRQELEKRFKGEFEVCISKFNTDPLKFA